GSDDDHAYRDLDHHQGVGDPRGLPDPGEGHRGEHRDDAYRSDVDRCGFPEPLLRQVEQVGDVAGPAAGDYGGAEGEFQQQVPADDPSEDLAERGVGVGVRAARGGHGGSQFGVADPGEPGDETTDDEGEHDGGAGVLLGFHTGEGEDPGADDDPDAEPDQVPGGETLNELAPAVAGEHVVHRHSAKNAHGGLP